MIVFERVYKVRKIDGKVMFPGILRANDCHVKRGTHRNYAFIWSRITGSFMIP